MKGMDWNFINIEKLSDSNFQIRKPKMELVLMICGVESTIITTNAFHTGTADFEEWTQKGKIARAVFDLSLSDSTLKQTRDATTANKKWDIILNTFRRHAILSKLKTRRYF